MKRLRESEDKTISGMKWFRDGPVYKPHFLSGVGVDAVAVDNYIDKLVKEHDNRFVIDAPSVTEELYFEIQYWETGDGDNVYVDILFNREFDRERDETKWGKKSYGATNEHGYVEDWLNNGGLEKLGITDAKITGVGWDDSKHVPRWSIELFTFSDRNIDGTFKRPNTSDSWTSSHSINGTEPFTLEEGKEISKAVMNYIIELFKANPKRVYYKPSDEIKTVDIPEHRLHSYDPSWKGSYTHNTGWFGFSCYIEDVYDENATNWRGNKGDYYRADENIITKLLEDKAAETLNDFLYEFNLEVVPDGCKASWYHGSEEDEKYGVLFEVSIKFKEIGIDSNKSYFAHTGNSFKDYWPGSAPKDIYKGKTFKRNPKRIKEDYTPESDIGWAIKMPNKMYYGYTWTKDINNAAIFNTEQEARNEFRRINDGSRPFKLVKVDLGGWNGYEVLGEKPLKESKIEESHAQGTCPICGEQIYSDEGCVKVDGVSGYVHEYHCTDDSLEAYYNFADKFWETHSSAGMEYYSNAKLFNLKAPKCKLKEAKNLKERVLDYDAWDEHYNEGAKAYFEGKTLDEVPVTGNAWFREAWQEGWKDSKAIDDEDARRAEAEYEEEEAAGYLEESKNLKERFMTAEEADFHEGDYYKNRYGWVIIIEELDGDYVHIKQYLDTNPDNYSTHMKAIPLLYEHLMNYHFTKLKNINDERA